MELHPDPVNADAALATRRAARTMSLLITLTEARETRQTAAGRGSRANASGLSPGESRRRAAAQGEHQIRVQSGLT